MEISYYCTHTSSGEGDCVEVCGWGWYKLFKTRPINGMWDSCSLGHSYPPSCLWRSLCCHPQCPLCSWLPCFQRGIVLYAMNQWVCFASLHASCIMWDWSVWMRYLLFCFDLGPSASWAFGEDESQCYSFLSTGDLLCIASCYISFMCHQNRSLDELAMTPYIRTP